METPVVLMLLTGKADTFLLFKSQLTHVVALGTDNRMTSSQRGEKTQQQQQQAVIN